MLQMLTEEAPVFQGDVRVNSWRSQLEGVPHDPSIVGSGLVPIGSDGLPAALVWGFVDDFKIHAPTKWKLIVALNAFMDLTLRLGLVCQCIKTKPLAQVQKYCGFIYDTTGVPTLRIPPDKCKRGLAVIRFLRAGGPTMDVSRLTLAMVTGLLQSMVEATPQRVGQTFLVRCLYNRLHALNDDPTEQPLGMRLYYTRMVLTAKECLDLDWWEAALWLNIRVQAYSLNQGTLGISYGDGSGSGTGGTISNDQMGWPMPNT
jgi:hypothetical protein